MAPSVHTAVRSTAPSVTVSAFVVIAVILCVSVGCGAVPATDNLVQCISAGSASQPLFWKQVYDGSKPQGLQAHQAWASTAKQPVDVTLVTQLSLQRIPTLEEMCKSWGGPVSAAVYMQFIQGSSNSNKDAVAKAATDIQAFFDRVEREGSCQLQVVLVSEIMADNTSSVLYPVNHLRNYALLQATTSLVFLNDVDNLVSKGLLQQLQQRWNQLHMACMKGNAFVIPAFEVSPTVGSLEERTALAKTAVAGTKPQLKALVDSNKLFQFQKFYKSGHGSTNYTRWFGGPEQSYPIQFTFGYEPWYIVSRLHVPLYDVRLRGYGQNKVLQGFHASEEGIKFNVWPDAWLVHKPHVLTSSVEFFKQKSTATFDMFHKNHAISHGSVRMMKGGKERYLPSLDESTDSCLKTLEWWQASRWIKEYGLKPN